MKKKHKTPEQVKHARPTPFFSDNIRRKPFFSPAIKTKKGPDPTKNLKKSDFEGKVYDIKGDFMADTQMTGSEVIILYNKKEAKTIRKAINKAKNEGVDYKIDLQELPIDSYFNLPPYDDRVEIQKILKNDDAKSHVEYGGRGIIPVNSETGNLDYDKSTHLRSKDGKPAGPHDEAATIQVETIHQEEMESGAASKKVPSGNFATDYTWHSHPGGKWKRKFTDSNWLTEEEFDNREAEEKLGTITSGSTYGGPSVVTRGYDLGPSDQDVLNAKKRYNDSLKKEITGTDGYYPLSKNFVIHKREKKVFFFNQNTSVGERNYSAVMSYEVFFNLK